MCRLSYIIVIGTLLFTAQESNAQSPHGKDFKMNCSDCHSSESWDVLNKDITFNHSNTDFKLTGEHVTVKCTDCHSSLEFNVAKKECMDCHTDMHTNTLGKDCGRCHTPKTWIVQDIFRLHQMSRFPLMGAHKTADCYDCHPTATNLRFEQLSVECVSCHINDYLGTTSPNHQQLGYSTNCIDCHSARSMVWTAANFEHNFFPLTGGHTISCTECHTSGTFSKIPSECISCHQNDFNNTKSPDHTMLGFSTSCNECHTLNPGWSPAKFLQHDGLYFPIYSGEHNNEWSSCNDCHNNPGDYSLFSCTICHEHNQASMDNEHRGINGYSYNSNSCYACHPSGNKSESFNHDATGFSLKGAHLTTECYECHKNGYAGTSSECNSCHQTDYDQSLDPNHKNLALSVICSDCHTTFPGWSPATFSIHDNYFALSGAHLSASCSECHSSGYTNTSSECSSCHQADYDQATNPDHKSLLLSTICSDCHTTQPGWSPAMFAIHNNYYALTGAHALISGECASCHNGDYTNTPNTCYGCHSNDYNSTTDPNHLQAGFPIECESCHSTTAWEPSTFDHDAQYFPIYSGKHREAWSSCSECHTIQNNYSVFSCIDCHEHNKTETDGHHENVTEYAYNSLSCYSCHPSGLNN